MDRSHSVRLTGSPETSPDRSTTARRPTVRIVKRRKLSRAARVSLVTAVAVSAVAFAAWRWRQPTSAPPAYQRSIVDVELTWKCEAGHTFTAVGQVEDRACAMCDRPAYPVTTYECKQHGSYEVAVRFARDSDGGTRVSQVRLPNADWVPASDPLLCPRCGQALVRKSTEELPAAKKRSG